MTNQPAVHEERTGAIGANLRRCRRYKGVSLQVLADRTGLSKSFLSMVENGQRQLDRRSHLNTLADALDVSVSELTGQPYSPPPPPNGDGGHGAVPKVRTALLESSLDEPADVQPRPIATLIDETEQVERLCAQSAYGAFGQRLPELLRELHVVATAGDATEREQALRALVRVYHATFYLLKDLGYLDLAHISVQHAREAARQLRDPAVSGLAAFVRIHALIPAGIYTAALTTARRAIEQLRPHLDDRTVAEVYGMLNLSAALICTTLGNEQEANAHLDEAQRTAERTGEGNAFGLHFGPTNVAVWRVALFVELGKNTEAIQIAESVNPGLIDAKGRQATFYADWGRALARLKGRERDAITKTKQAEKLAPEQIRNNPLVREAVAHLLHRPGAQLPSSVASDLRGLAYRMGLGAAATGSRAG